MEWEMEWKTYIFPNGPVPCYNVAIRKDADEYSERTSFNVVNTLDNALGIE